MIHQYKLNGYNIVLDVHSGSVHAVDEVAYDIIAWYREYGREEIVEKIQEKYPNYSLSREEILDCMDDVEELKRTGQLFTEDIYESLAGRKKSDDVIKAMCLHVSHTCNLSCEYCFARQGKYQGTDALMSFEVGKKALDFLVERSGSRVNLEVDFFGGEPLMNWDVVKRLVEYGRSLEKRYKKNFRFTLTTNGVLLDDEVIEFANKEMHNVVLSLDGRREVHDRFRKNYAGKGSYDVILPKFQKLVESRNGEGYYMRGTFTHHNTDFTNDVLHMADLGFTELSMEPVVSSEQDANALTEEDLPKLFEQYEILAREMLKRKKEGRPFSFYHYTIDLENGPCVHKRILGCGSGTEYLAVTPWGDLYPCHQFVNDPSCRMGSLDEGITNEVLQEEFKACNIYSHQECVDCWAKLYCSGGCAANSYHATGKITGVYDYGCRLFRKRMECAIMMKVAEADEE
ncbi:MAG: thioether cross-link-forming SCIFF peptide maturase [Filifactor alocis]|nr:thioether cross-link-forming SCIFF peptide maturase [Filifactor alocis]